MKKADEYRQMAASCLTSARRAKDFAEKAVLIQMARVWHNVVAKIETGSQADMIHESPLATPEPVVQQQQQQQQPQQFQQPKKDNSTA